MRDFTLEDIERVIEKQFEKHFGLQFEKHYQLHKEERRLEMQEVLDEGFKSVIYPLFETVEEMLAKLETRMNKMEARLTAKMDIFMDKVVDHEVLLRKAGI